MALLLTSAGLLRLRAAPVAAVAAAGSRRSSGLSRRLAAAATVATARAWPLLLPARAPAASVRTLAASHRRWLSAGPPGGTSGSSPPPPPPPHPPTSFFTSPLGWWRGKSAQLKAMMANFGYLTLATYFGVYVCTLGSVYGLVRAGLVQGPDVNAFLNGWFVKRAVWGDKEIAIEPAYTDFATAWVITKTTEPLRLVGTIAAVPLLVKRAPAGLLRLLRVPESAIPAAAAAGGGGGKAAGALVLAASGLPRRQAPLDADAAAAAGASR